MAKKKAAPKKEQVDVARYIVQNEGEQRLVNAAALADAIEEMQPCMVALEETTRRIDINRAGVTMRVLYRGK